MHQAWVRAVPVPRVLINLEPPMKLIPFPGFLIVKPIDESKTKSGFELAETADKDKPERGTVVAVGDPRTLENGTVVASRCAPGDVIVFRKFSPDEIKVDGEILLILEEGDVQAKVAE